MYICICIYRYSYICIYTHTYISSNSLPNDSISYKAKINTKLTFAKFLNMCIYIYIPTYICTHTPH